MKKQFTLFVITALTIGVIAQPPQKMSYQAVIRSSSGQLVSNQAVGMRISILQGSATGTPVYVETQTPTTNVNGLATVEIGGGTVITGTFEEIDWSTGPYFVKTEADPSGGTSYSITGTSQILSVPYAQYSKTAQTADYNSLSNLPVLNISNWNIAYEWGNHAGLYRANSWVPAWTDVTGKPTLATVATSGSYNDLSNKPTILNSQWTTSGSNIYYNTGNVGIGVAAPSNKLEVNGNTAIDGILSVSGKVHGGGYSSGYSSLQGYNLEIGGLAPTATNGQATIYLHSHNSVAHQLRYTGGVLFLEAAGNGYGTNSTPYLQVNGGIFAAVNGGSVGIGTTNPGAYKLFVNGGSVLISDGTGLSGTLKFTGHTYIGSVDWGNLTLSAGTKSGDAVMALVTENQTRLFISGNGNVGIGTTTPTTKLDVNGVINVNNNKITNVATPTNGTDAANKAYVDNSRTHYIGESYGGGIVFYVYDNGQHGLIAPITDQSKGVWWISGDFLSTFSNFVRDGIKGGLANTERMVIQAGELSFAASLCANLIIGHFGDWYLPSKYELNLLYLQRAAVGGFEVSSYWSSTEANSNSAWAQFFDDGEQTKPLKNNYLCVRAIRAF